MHLEAVAKKDKEILWNVLQKYMHEWRADIRKHEKMQ